jgi:hypothetical protein
MELVARKRNLLSDETWYSFCFTQRYIIKKRLQPYTGTDLYHGTVMTPTANTEYFVLGF